ncbi:hypothetical protein Xbuh_17940 [Xanthomonas axonopodis pv. bauhiniae]|nr:hypothetical protein Xbuh_17940 [Xanthomonas axonopodis pv. bauhiniae]
MPGFFLAKLKVAVAEVRPQKCGQQHRVQCALDLELWVQLADGRHVEVDDVVADHGIRALKHFQGLLDGQLPIHAVG